MSAGFETRAMEERRMGTWGKRPYGISALLVLPRNTARKPRRQERSYSLRCLHRKQERGIPVGILADTVVFMAGVYKEFLTPSSAPCFYRPSNRDSREFWLAHGYI